MPNKWSVTGCNTNHQDGPQKHVFKFPDDPDLSKKWGKFLNRPDFRMSLHSVICMNHFEEKFIDQHFSQKTLLNYSMNHIPIIRPSFIHLSLATVPSECRKPPTIGSFHTKTSIRPQVTIPVFAEISSKHFLIELSNSLRILDDYVHTFPNYSPSKFPILLPNFSDLLFSPFCVVHGFLLRNDRALQIVFIL